MKIKTKIDTKNNIRLHTASGKISKEFMVAELAKIYSSPDFQTSMSSYWDLSLADLSLFSLQDTEELADFVKEDWTHTEQTKVAFWAPKALNHLISKKIAKQFTGHVSKKIEVFDQEAAALNWLKQR